MKIYDKQRTIEFFKKLGFDIDINDDKELEKISNKIIEETESYKKLSYLNEGSSRTVYNIEGIDDIVLKIDYTQLDENKKAIEAISFQGEIEKRMYENNTYSDMIDIYAISKNRRFIICEKLLPFSYETALESDPDFVEYVIMENIMEEEYKEFEYEDLNEKYKNENFEDYCDMYIEDYFELRYQDIHLDNIGVSLDGQIKVLDAGYGDGEVEIEAIDYIIRNNIKCVGAIDFNDRYVSDIIYNCPNRNIFMDGRNYIEDEDEKIIEEIIEEKIVKCDICGKILKNSEEQFNNINEVLCQNCYEAKEHNNAWW